MNETFISRHNIILLPFSAHLANPLWGAYLYAQAALFDGSLTIEIYGTEGDEKWLKLLTEKAFYIRSLKQN